MMRIKKSGAAHRCCARVRAKRAEAAAGERASISLDFHQGIAGRRFQQWREAGAFDHPPELTPPMPRHETLDVRGMQPPEPLERVLTLIDDFVPGDKLTLLIDCKAQPLYRILELNGFGYRAEPGTQSVYEVTIWAKDK
jgi:hypothetical protein